MNFNSSFTKDNILLDKMELNTWNRQEINQVWAKKLTWGYEINRQDMKSTLGIWNQLWGQEYQPWGYKINPGEKKSILRVEY